MDATHAEAAARTDAMVAEIEADAEAGTNAANGPDSAVTVSIEQTVRPGREATLPSPAASTG